VDWREFEKEIPVVSGFCRLKRLSSLDFLAHPVANQTTKIAKIHLAVTGEQTIIRTFFNKWE
jgi:hypothetical protein